MFQLVDVQLVFFHFIADEFPIFDDNDRTSFKQVPGAFEFLGDEFGDIHESAPYGDDESDLGNPDFIIIERIPKEFTKNDR